jgi:histidine triad (HIT) family protein
MSENCIFGRIIRRQNPAYVVTEDEHIIVFPSKENHLLVAPSQHIPNIYFFDEATGSHIMRIAIEVVYTITVVNAIMIEALLSNK